MFNLGFSEILIVGVIALIFIGPEQLPDVARMVARFINELRRASSDFQSNMTGGITDDLQQRLRDTRRDLENQIKADPNSVAQGQTVPTEPVGGPAVATDPVLASVIDDPDAIDSPSNPYAPPTPGQSYHSDHSHDHGDNAHEGEDIHKPEKKS